MFSLKETCLLWNKLYKTMLSEILARLTLMPWLPKFIRKVLDIKPWNCVTKIMENFLFQQNVHIHHAGELILKNDNFSYFHQVQVGIYESILNQIFLPFNVKNHRHSFINFTYVSFVQYSVHAYNWRNSNLHCATD